MTYKTFPAQIEALYSSFSSAGSTKNITFQVTEDCNLACSYCYQKSKSKKIMSFDTAKKMIDLILSGEKGFHEYLHLDSTDAIILDFIGGEPFLQIDLIDKVVDYFRLQAILRGHPFAERFMISISSNGTLYFTKPVQDFLKKNRGLVSLGITVDGTKKLHDSCRVFPDGSGSYELAHAAAMDLKEKGYALESKVTLAPENLDYLYDSIVQMVQDGYTSIHANCVYEDVWKNEDAVKLYEQIVRISEYMDQYNLKDKIDISLLDKDLFEPLSEDDNENWCGGTGKMLAVDPDGLLYPCIRYTPSSLNNEQEPYIIGNVDDGIELNDPPNLEGRICVSPLLPLGL